VAGKPETWACNCSLGCRCVQYITLEQHGFSADGMTWPCIRLPRCSTAVRAYCYICGVATSCPGQVSDMTIIHHIV
jgi:hypothetical protein